MYLCIRTEQHLFLPYQNGTFIRHSPANIFEYVFVSHHSITGIYPLINDDQTTGSIRKNRRRYADIEYNTTFCASTGGRIFKNINGCDDE